MKTLKITSIRTTIQMVFFALLLTSSCAQSDKKTDSKNIANTTKTVNNQV